MSVDEEIFPMKDIIGTGGTGHDVGPDGQPTFIPRNTLVDADGNPLSESNATAGIGDQQHEETEEEMDVESEAGKLSEPLRVRRFATILNLLNSLLGAGILGVPGSFRHIGIIPSVFLLAMVAILSHVATVMTIKLQRRVDADGFDDLALKVFGKFGSISLSIMIMLFCIACSVAYLIIGTDSIISFLSLMKINVKGTYYRALTVFILWAVFPGALTFPRNIGFLQYFSFANFVCICFFILAMIIKAFLVFPESGTHDNLNYGSFGIGVFQSISIYGLAFALPVVVLPIMNPYNQDLHKRSIVSGWACFLCFVMVVIPGVLGYLIQGSSAGSNILNSFKNNDVLISICRGGFLIVVSASYPCLAQSMISSWSALIYKVNLPRDLPTSKRLVVVGCSNIFPLLIAMFLPNAGPALSVGGAVGGCLADFFYPPAMWAKISKKPLYHWQNILCIIFAIFGIVACVISTYLAVLDAIESFK